jgi:hypothetical protein
MISEELWFDEEYASHTAEWDQALILKELLINLKLIGQLLVCNLLINSFLTHPFSPN